MKLIIVRKTRVHVIHKGGKGSGHFGHRGRPGLVGGSSSEGNSGDKAVFDAMQSIYDNPIMRRIATAYAADGPIDDVANISEEVASALNIEMTSTGEDTADVEQRFFDAYEEATSLEGYYVKNQSNISPEREAWERYYYGKVVGGYSKGQAFASKAIRDFVKDGTVPTGNFSNNKPKKAVRVREQQAIDTFSKDEQYWLFNEPKGRYWKLGSNPSAQDIERLLKKMPK